MQVCTPATEQAAEVERSPHTTPGKGIGMGTRRGPDDQTFVNAGQPDGSPLNAAARRAPHLQAYTSRLPKPKKPQHPPELERTHDGVVVCKGEPVLVHELRTQTRRGRSRREKVRAQAEHDGSLGVLGSRAAWLTCNDDSAACRHIGTACVSYVPCAHFNSMPGLCASLHVTVSERKIGRKSHLVTLLIPQC